MSALVERAKVIEGLQQARARTKARLTQKRSAALLAAILAHYDSMIAMVVRLPGRPDLRLVVDQQPDQG